MTTYLFPGQGSQIKGMGKSLFDEFPELTKNADDLLGYSIKELCIDDPNSLLNKTQYTQSALYVVNALSYQQKIKQIAKSPDFVIGHSLGEINALQASGAISFEQGLKLVVKRGELMSKAPKGAMTAVLGLDEKSLEEILLYNNLSKIDIANYNTSSQIVISGLEEDINSAQTCLERAGVLFIQLNTSGAFHSRYMLPAKEQFKKYLDKQKFSELQIPTIANINAKPYQQDRIVHNLAQQITHSVKWLQSIHFLLEQDEVAFVEIGVGDVLSKLVKNIKDEYILTKRTKPNNPTAETKVSLDKKSELTNYSDQIIGKSKKTIDEDGINYLNFLINNWNDAFQPGANVKVKGYDNKFKTRTKAVMILGNRAVIYLEGFSGYFELKDVSSD